MNGLVLSGGGARAAYQVGVLSYIAEKAPAVSFPTIVGVSAGAINAAFVGGHRAGGAEALEALSQCWNELTTEQVFNTNLGAVSFKGARWFWTLGGAGSPVGPRLQGLLDTSPLREFLTGRLDPEGIVANVESGRLRALGLTATRYSTGQTVTFMHASEEVLGWDRVRRAGRRTQIGVKHVMASCALPLIFPAIEVDGEYYGDGSMRAAAPLAPAIHLGAGRLLAISTRYSPSKEEVERRAVNGYPPPAQILGMLFNTIFLDTLETDAERLRRINRVLEALPPGTPGPADLRHIRLLVVRPSRDLGALAEGFKRQLPRSVRLLMRGLGIQRVRGPDLLSYLTFEPSYTGRVMELGYEDALSSWTEIERFLADER